MHLLIGLYCLALNAKPHLEHRELRVTGNCPIIEFLELQSLRNINLMFREIPEELKKAAASKLNEVPNRIEEDVAHIQQWMAKQPHLNFEIENDLILSFLRCNKFSLERTKEKIDNHYTARTLMPEIYTNRDPLLPEIQHLLNSGVILPLPNVDPDDGSRIFMQIYSSNLDHDVSLTDVSKLTFMIFDILLMEDDHMIINGVKPLVQCKDFDLKFLRQVTPRYLKNLSYNVEKALPFRVKGIHVLNCGRPFIFAYNLLKTFVSSKMSQRMTLTSEADFAELGKKSPHLLPEEMGGNNGSIKELTVIWKKKVESYREWFLKEETLKSDESLRIGKPNICADDLGVVGSFRQLEID